MLHDLKHAYRMLMQSKGWTLVVLLSLAIGIGATTALFTAVNGLLLQTVPIPDPHSLVVLKWTGQNDMVRSSSDYGFSTPTAEGRAGNVRSTFSYATYQQLRAANQTMTDLIAGTSLESFNFASNGTSEIATAFGVSGNYFKVLGVSAMIGRTIEESDEQPGADPVAVISHAFWRRRFGGDPSIAGKTVRLNTTTATIVGVLPPSYIGIQRMADTVREVWVPFVLERQLVTPSQPFNSGPAAKHRLDEPTNWYIQVGGRLKPGVTLEQVKGNLAGPFQQAAQAGMTSYMAGLSDAERQLSRNRDRDRSAIPQLLVLPGARGIYDLDRTASRSASVLSAIVVLLLLIVCANVANLLLSRAAARYREVSVRLSMGASRRRLVRQLLTESLLLSGTGGALGIAIGYWGKKLLPFGQNTAIDWQVLAFVAGISMVTGLVFGLVPALRATQVDLASAMKENSRSVVVSRTWLSKALLVTQVAISVVLLIGAGLFVRTLQNLQSVDIGFNAGNILMFRVNPALNRYSPERTNQLYQRMQSSLEALPGVQSVTFVRNALLSGSTSITGIYRQGQTEKEAKDVYYMAVAPKFFETMQIPMLMGRDFNERDVADPDASAIINETAAKKYWPNENPIGQRLGQNIEESGKTEIIGVIRDTKYDSVRDAAPATMYTPIRAGTRSLTVLVRTANDPASLTETVRSAMQQVDPDVPMTGVTTQSDQVAGRFAQERLFALAYSLFGALALLLACIGLFGLMSYSVSRRTNEIGIRMALGAERAGVVGMVLRESMLMVLIGVGVGLAGALAGGRFVQSVLFGLTSTDVWTISGAIAVTALVSLAAGYLPARRASRVDPMVALRYE